MAADPIPDPQLNDFLRQFSGEEVLYLPTPGNGGDALITCGTVHLLERLGIQFQPIRNEDDVTDRVVLLGGGGNFVPLYGHARARLLEFQRKAKRVVLLPHTIRGHEETIQQLGSHVTLIARDEVSQRHALTHRTQCEVLIGHDMAFHLDVARIDAMNASEMEDIYRRRCWQRKFDDVPIRGKTLASFLRTDKEAASENENNDGDLSAIFSLGSNVALSPLSTWCLFKVMRMPQRILTDRLHVGVGSLLVGTPTTIKDNNYGKIAPIFEHSIRQDPVMGKLATMSTTP